MSPPKKQKSVLLALTDTHHGFYVGAARYAREHGWHLVTDMIYTASLPHGWQGDGILSFIGNRNDLAEFILANPAPTVEISLVRADIDLPRVEADNHLIGRLAAGHFVERGFRHFLWVPFQNDVPNRERRDGFHQGLSEAGASMSELPTRHWEIGPNGSQDWAARRRIVSEELGRLPKPLAVFCYNDCVAADIIAACDQVGIVVPDEVAVLGVDNDAMLCESINTPLSSVRHELEGLAYEAAADPELYPELGEPWQVTKLYYQGGFTRGRLEAIGAAMEERGLENPYAEWLKERDPDRLRDDRITTRVECAEYFHVRDAALIAHATQIDPDGFFFSVPREVQAEAWPTEDFELVDSKVPTTLPEDDLFAGLR